MALDLTGTVELLGGRKVVGLGVGEETCLHAPDVQLNSKCLVSLDGGEVLGETELGGGHVVGGGNGTNGDGVARPTLDLLAIGNGGVHGCAEVDVVVGRCQRSNLASNRWVLAIVGETTSNNPLVES